MTLYMYVTDRSIKYIVFLVLSVRSYFPNYIDVRLTEYEMNEGEVLKRLNDVTISKREVEIVS